MFPHVAGITLIWTTACGVHALATIPPFLYKMGLLSLFK